VIEHLGSRADQIDRVTSGFRDLFLAGATALKISLVVAKTHRLRVDVRHLHFSRGRDKTARLIITVQYYAEGFQTYCVNFWDAFKSNLGAISTFLQTEDVPAAQFRNNEAGGHLIFRPIGFLPLVKASLVIHDRTEAAFGEIFRRFDGVNFGLDGEPWRFIAWNPTTRKMIMNSDSIIQLLLI
jgi:hypothetical protein